MNFFNIICPHLDTSHRVNFHYVLYITQKCTQLLQWPHSKIPAFLPSQESLTSIYHNLLYNWFLFVFMGRTLSTQIQQVPSIPMTSWRLGYRACDTSSYCPSPPEYSIHPCLERIQTSCNAPLPQNYCWP